MCVRVGRGRRRRWVLRGVSGAARAGRLACVLGPSGCGKTTLLDALAGTYPAAGGAAVGGAVRACAGATLAYVRQESAFFSNLTTRETLALVGALRGLVGDELDAAVDGTLRRMALAPCADTLVGGDTGGPDRRGISGGERKRLSIACELVSRGAAAAAAAGAAGTAGAGAIVLVDEPTTGLDAFQADRVVGKLAELARREGAAVVATLHQPRSATFAKCDDVVLLTGQGRVAFAGEVKAAVDYFAAAGYPCPEHHNAAEHLIDLVSVDETDATKAEEDLERIRALERLWVASAERRAFDDGREERQAARERRASGREGRGSGGRSGPRGRVGVHRQLGLLLRRALRQSRRDAFVNVTRAAAAAGLGLIFGALFGKLPLRGEKAVSKRTALVMQLAINASFISMTKSLNAFPRERKVVQAETKAGLYTPVPYFLGKLAVEAPLDAALSALFGVVAAPLNGLRAGGRPALYGALGLMSASASGLGLLIGAAAPSVEVALALGPCAMVLSILLGDVVGAFSDVPEAMRPLANLSCVRWGLMAMLAAEFTGLELDMTPEGSAAGASGGGGSIAEKYGAPKGWTGPPPPGLRIATGGAAGSEDRGPLVWLRAAMEGRPAGGARGTGGGGAPGASGASTPKERVTVRGEEVLAGFGVHGPHTYSRATAAQARLCGALLLTTLALLGLQGGGGGGHCDMDPLLRCEEAL